MNIIIIGNGKVGYTLAEQLANESHDVTMVDTSDAVLQRASDALDIMVVKGNGVSTTTLQSAGAKDADLLVAVTSSDEVNMVCCRTAKNLGTPFTIARIRNIEYTTAGLGDLKRDMGIDIIINPENATAIEITRLLRFPSAANVDTFCRGRVELISFRVHANDFLVGKPLHALTNQVKKLSLLFCIVERGEEVIVPNGDFVPQGGDHLYVIGRPASLDDFLHLLGRHQQKVKTAFIVGGGKISLYLIKALEKMRIKVKIVEQRLERCRQISELAPRAVVVQGDGTEQELLDSEGMPLCDAFIALTDRDEDNLMISFYAMQRKVSKVIAKCNRQNYAGIARELGLESVISPKLITTEQILQTVRGMENSQGNIMTALYRIANNRAEAMEFIAGASTKQLGIPLYQLKLKPGILIAVIMRGSKVIIPEGSTCILQGDSVILISSISREHAILDLNDIYDMSVSVHEAGGVNEF